MTNKFFICFVPLPAFLIVGCSNPEADAPNARRQEETSPETMILGRWQAEKEASEARWGEDRDLAKRMSLQLDVEWEFKTDNKFEVYKGERSITGTWKTESISEDKILVEIDSDADPTDKRVVLTFVFDSYDRATFSSDEAEGELVLVRKK